MSSSRSIAAARSRHTIEQPPRPPFQQSQVKQNTIASDVQTKISVQDAINIVTRRITRLEQMTQQQQQLQVPDNSCIVDNNVLEDIISRLDKLERTQEETLDSFRREFESKIETLTRETNEKLVDIDLAFAEIEKSIQIDQESHNDNTEISSADVAETIKLEISSS
jgi:hypothetical protein